MKKTNNYVAPVAEVIEMQMPVVLMDSNNATGNQGTGNLGGGGLGDGTGLGS
jgi:N-methylhydantoinase B/oxoprolinase/acetone carboxylase alpha subunit